MTPAALQGTFSDMRIVKGRKVVQLFIEIPMEQADAALALLGGLPRPDNPVHVAIARLSLPGSPAGRPADSSSAGEAQPAPPPTKRSWFSHLPSRRAALLCADPGFQRWLRDVPGGAPIITSEATPRAWMLKRYDITSRAELDTNEKARASFEADERAFFAWRDEQRWGSGS